MINGSKSVYCFKIIAIDKAQVVFSVTYEFGIENPPGEPESDGLRWVHGVHDLFFNVIILLSFFDNVFLSSRVSS